LKKAETRSGFKQVDVSSLIAIVTAKIQRSKKSRKSKKSSVSCKGI